MKIIVDEMPKHTSQCPFYDYTHSSGRHCMIDGLSCEVPETKCRWLEPLEKPIKDDCK